MTNMPIGRLKKQTIENIKSEIASDMVNKIAKKYIDVQSTFEGQCHLRHWYEQAYELVDKFAKGCKSCYQDKPKSS